jgi:transcriptional regulator with XRE-family HTH domain
MNRADEEAMRIRVGQNIRVARAARHISQVELAFRAEIHRSQISLIENGKRPPALATAVGFAGIFEIGVDDLLAGISFTPADSARGASFVADELDLKRVLAEMSVGRLDVEQ